MTDVQVSDAATGGKDLTATADVQWALPPADCLRQVLRALRDDRQVHAWPLQTCPFTAAVILYTAPANSRRKLR